jgi:hypothetical protein
MIDEDRNYKASHVDTLTVWQCSNLTRMYIIVSNHLIYKVVPENYMQNFNKK